MRIINNSSAVLFFVITILTSGCSGGGSNNAAKSTPNNTKALSTIESEQFTGSILFRISDNDIIRQGFGSANNSENIANTADTKFRIASLTKAFTALAIVQLKNRNFISSYDDSLSKYIEKFDNDSVTIRHLLNHRSGVMDYVFVTNPNIPHTPSQLVDVVKSSALEFVPGSTFSYSNSNYMLLGYLIEKLTGLSYEDYLENEIFSVLGSTSIEYGESNIVGQEYAQGYANKTQTQLSDYLDMSVPYSAGALSSNLVGMEIWADSFNSNLLVTAADKEDIFSQGEYSFGWFVTTLADKTVYTHTGGINGFSTTVVILPDDQSLIIALSNVENMHEQINRIVEKLIADYL